MFIGLPTVALFPFINIFWLWMSSKSPFGMVTNKLKKKKKAHISSQHPCLVGIPPNLNAIALEVLSLLPVFHTR
jgi:hypothetical protein